MHDDTTMENSALIKKKNSFSHSQGKNRNRKILNNNYSNPTLGNKLPCTKHFLIDPTNYIMSEPDIHELSYKIYP